MVGETSPPRSQAAMSWGKREGGREGGREGESERDRERRGREGEK